MQRPRSRRTSTKISTLASNSFCLQYRTPTEHQGDSKRIHSPHLRPDAETEEEQLKAAIAASLQPSGLENSDHRQPDIEGELSPNKRKNEDLTSAACCRIPYGKHKGKTYGQVHEEDTTYFSKFIIPRRIYNAEFVGAHRFTMCRALKELGFLLPGTGLRDTAPFAVPLPRLGFAVDKGLRSLEEQGLFFPITIHTGKRKTAEHSHLSCELQSALRRLGLILSEVSCQN
jgi:hypothetical protein